MGRFRWRRRGRAALPLQQEGWLSDWREGEEALVVEVSGRSSLAARLRELGLTPGARIRVLRHGCPLVVQIGEGRLAMRRRDAAAVRVRATSDGPPPPPAATLPAASGA